MISYAIFMMKMLKTDPTDQKSLDIYAKVSLLFWYQKHVYQYLHIRSRFRPFVSIYFHYQISYKTTKEWKHIYSRWGNYFFAQRIVTNAKDILNWELKITFCSRIYKTKNIKLGWYQLKDVLYEKEVQGSTIAFKLWRFDKSWRQDVDVKSRSFQTKVNEFYVTTIKV